MRGVASASASSEATAKSATFVAEWAFTSIYSSLMCCSLGKTLWTLFLVEVAVEIPVVLFTMVDLSLAFLVLLTLFMFAMG